MVKGKNNDKKIGIILFTVVMLIISLFIMVDNYYKKQDTSNMYALSYDTSNYIYLSDINYLAGSYVEDGYYIRLDKNNNSGLISVNIDGKEKSFIKGISAWATSELVYDLTDLDYDYFTAYLGVDAKETSTYYNSGVIFSIYTSTDNINYEEVYKSKILKGFNDAEYVKIDIKDAKYLKLYAYENGDSWYSQWYDDAVYADAKLIKEGYTDELIEDNTLIKPISEYDKILKEYESDIQSGDFNKIKDYELTLLQREFVKNADYNILQALINYSSEYKEALEWLMNDYTNLELYVLGGKPDGNYATSLQVLNSLFKEYKNDLNDQTKISNGDTLGNLYRKMMITLSLTHSASVGLWVTGAPENPLDPNGSSALRRYQIYKDLYNEDKLNKDIFENLTIEEMRFVMNNIIDDEEIVWLNDYTSYKESKDPYSYIKYTFDYDYNKDIYYAEENKSKWDNLYNNNLTIYGVSYGYPKLWIVFEEGSVCGGLSKTGSNIQGVYGIPSSVVSQPGHAAYIYMNLINKAKVWTLGNDVYGWGKSGKTEKLSVRMPNSWGDGDYASQYPASYILLAQSALNDYDNYKLAEEILMTASLYDDNSILETIYEKALTVQNINFDAWLNLVNLYIAKDASVEELYNLVERIIDNLKNYPLPMYDLIRLIENNIEDKASLVAITNITTKTLEEDANLKDSKLVQEGAIKQVANYLLSVNNNEIATFSFDGENKNKIVLNERFQDNEVKWQYNLTSNNDDWHTVSGNEVLLTDEEIALIHPETDIMIRIIGALDNVYNIDIKKEELSPELTINDLENTIINYNELMEWSYDGLTWQQFSNELPVLDGDIEVIVRIMRHGVYLESDSMTFTFTKDDDIEEKSYITKDNLSIASVSSEEVNREDNSAKNAIDGNRNTMWHTLWDGSDKDKYIVIKLQEAKYLTGLEYVPRITSSNGIVTNAKVLVSMDNENWTEVVSETDWELDNSPKYVAFNEVTLAMYVKLVGVETSGNYMSAAMINLFEDKTRTSIPTASLEYSETKLTNQDVVVKLVNPSKHITILNNNGSDTYTFTENGTFTFEFVDDYGNQNTLLAEVNYIDKLLPEGSISYSTIKNTLDPVTVTLTSNEEIIILNNDGLNTYTFTENGQFEFIYQDLAGNINKTLAVVSWINNSNDDNNEVIDDNIDNNNSNNNSSSNKPNKKPNTNKDEEKEDNKDNNSDVVVKEKDDNNVIAIIGYTILASLIVGCIIIYVVKRNNKEK